MEVTLMPKYKFADIAYNITDKKMPEPGDEDLYIGLEHLDSGSLRVTRWGSDVELVGQKLCMKKGDILFGRRNTYLRRAAIAPHDGIFSAHGMIFRPNTNVMDPDFFPFFISSDYFMDAAIRISVGSLSPTVNWKTLKELEFYLPDLEQQRKTSEILAAANETKEAYQDLLAKTDELVKSQFIEMFGDPNKLPQEALTTIGALTTVVTGATPSRKRSDYYNGTIPWVKTGEIEQGIINDAEEHITDLAVAETNCKILPVNTIMLAMYGVGKTRGQSGILKIEAATNQACAAILPNETYDPHFLLYFLRNQYEEIRRLGKGTQQTNLNLSIVRGIPVPKASIAKQREYSAFVEQSDKSKFELKKAIENISELMKTILQQDLSC